MHTTTHAKLYNSSVNGPRDWQYKTTNQQGLGGRSVPWPRGKVLGGSSAINGLYLVRQPAVEQEAWSNLLQPLGHEAQELWNWDNMLKAMKKSEKFNAPEDEMEDTLHKGAPKRKHPLAPYKTSSHGSDGPIHHAWPEEYPSVGAFLQTGQQQLHMPVNHDPYGGNNSGPFLSLSSINPSNWTRSFARTGYLDPIQQRPNLHVLTAHQATKIVFDHSSKTPRATGVQYAKTAHGKVRTIKAEKEVILAAGVIGSPQLLQLSGVGHKSILDPLNISQVANVPGVGYHLQDHLSGAVTFTPTKDRHIAMPPTKITSDAEKNSYVNGAVIYTPLSKVADVEQTVHNITSQMDKIVNSYDAPSTVKEGLRVGLEQVANKIYAVDAPAIEILWSISYGNMNIQCGLQHPTSQGSVKITSRSAFDHPAVDAAYILNEVDREVLRKGCQLARKLGQSAPLNRYTGEESSPGNKVQSDEQWDQYIQQNFGTEYHPSGSCSMLPLEHGGVVDERMRVYHTSGLRVVDSSVPPLSLSQHLMTVTYGLAEMGAEMILEDNE